MCDEETLPKPEFASLLYIHNNFALFKADDGYEYSNDNDTILYCENGIWGGGDVNNVIKMTIESSTQDNDTNRSVESSTQSNIFQLTTNISDEYSNSTNEASLEFPSGKDSLDMEFIIAGAILGVFFIVIVLILILHRKGLKNSCKNMISEKLRLKYLDEERDGIRDTQTNSIHYNDLRKKHEITKGVELRKDVIYENDEEVLTHSKDKQHNKKDTPLERDKRSSAMSENTFQLHIDEELKKLDVILNSSIRDLDEVA